MSQVDHNHWAKILLKHLVERVVNYDGQEKPISYSDLAEMIDYPKPYVGSQFGYNIGGTLAEMGHLFDQFQAKYPPRVPYIQSMVINKSSKLPGDGFEEFYPGYSTLSTEKKRDVVAQEYKYIFDFGENWLEVCKLLEIDIDTSNNSHFNQHSGKLFNPYGSEGSPEHQRLRDYIAENPEIVKVYNPIETHTEYPLKTHDSIDVFFEEEHILTAVEVKSIRSGKDDLERGIYQCIKYRELVKAEEVANGGKKPVAGKLVIEGKLPHELVKLKDILGITVYEEIVPEK